MDFSHPIYQNLLRFANHHKIILQDQGEVGFGRPCVGFTHGDNYINFNPTDAVKYEYIPELYDERLEAPRGVNAYHKHDCLAVLVENGDYDTALVQLNDWINHLEDQGEVKITPYPTGAVGIQALLTGVIGHAVTYTTPPAAEPGDERSE